MRDPERWKDRVELSLDGRQIFFLFFGTAVTACLIFVGGVFVGKRIEHNAAPSISAEDPLAALDQLETEESDDGLTFHDALLREDKRRAREAAATKPRPALRPEAPSPAVSEPRPVPHSDEPRRLPSPPPVASPHPAARVTAHPVAAKPALPAAPSGRFTLQLSSFADPADAEDFAQKIRGAGYRPVVVRSEVPGKGVFFRVRIGDYASRAGAEQARAEFETRQHATAMVAQQ